MYDFHLYNLKDFSLDWSMYRESEIDEESDPFYAIVIIEINEMKIRNI